MPEHTTLEWTFEPNDYFEGTYRYAAGEFDITVADGRAVATLKVPANPVPDHLDRAIRKNLRNIFLARQLTVHRSFKLLGPTTYQSAAGCKTASTRVRGEIVLVMGMQSDIVGRDSAGNVIYDSRRERIAMLNEIVPKLEQSPDLYGMCESYDRSTSDPDNEFLHLYEIRDALCEHYGNGERARKALAISRNDWNRLGELANEKPFDQGRHRGKHPAGRRAATRSELEEARTLVQNWIIAFARAVKGS